VFARSSYSTIRPAREVLSLLDRIKARVGCTFIVVHQDIQLSTCGTCKCSWHGPLPRWSNTRVQRTIATERWPQVRRLRACPRFHTILSLTLSSSSLLSPVLKLLSPSAIIVQGSLLPQVLELIYELDEFGRYFVIVLGDSETDASVVSKASKPVKDAHWADLVAQDKAAPTITNPTPGNCHPFSFSQIGLAHHSLVQIRMVLPFMVYGMRSKGFLTSCFHSEICSLCSS